MDAFIDELAKVVAETSRGPSDRDPIEDLVRQGDIGEWCHEYLLDHDIKLNSIDSGWLEQDAIDSYNLAVIEIGKRVRAGEPVPECLLPTRSKLCGGYPDEL